MKQLIDKLAENKMLSDEEFSLLLTCPAAEEENDRYLYEQAARIRAEQYGNKIFIRGLIEFTNYCKNDCYYCGIRKGNEAASRYRLSKEEILECCQTGYELGFRTFVLQGGEDPYYRDDIMTDLIYGIKNNYPDCALTLSCGEKEKSSYLAYFNAGADRYLLRHETADQEHYGKLHPSNLSLANRKRCLWDLKEIGYQVGCGIMVGSPYQTVEHLIEDLKFMKELEPHMVGIGPFLPHHQTPFAKKEKGSLKQTLRMLAIVRLMFPDILLPATTALGTIEEGGREKGILAGANVVMPNLSPVGNRKKYELYDDKICTGEEAAESLSQLKEKMQSIGYRIVVDRGDCTSRR